MSELKPCPFCGGKDIKVFTNSVSCMSLDCSASGPDLGHCDNEKCRELAIDAWNRRTPANALIPTEEELERVFTYHTGTTMVGDPRPYKSGIGAIHALLVEKLGGAVMEAPKRIKTSISADSVIVVKQGVYIRSDLVEKLIPHARHTEECFEAMAKSCSCTCGLSELIKEVRG